MQVQSLCSTPMCATTPRAAAPAVEAIPASPHDVAHISVCPAAPSCESVGPSSAAAAAPAVVQTSPAVAASAPPPAVLLEETPAPEAAPQGINLQQAVQQAASAAGLSESGAAEVLREVSGSGADDPHQVKEKITKIVMDQLDVEKELVTDDATFAEDLGADSLDTVEVLMAIQEEFGFDSIPDEDAQAITTVGEAVAYVQKRLGNGEGGGEDLF
jgi:acyl carrier protein